MEVFEIDTDLEHEYEEPRSLRRKSKKAWEPLFDPKQWWRDNEERSIEANVLKYTQLMSFGKAACEWRRLFIDRANEQVEQSVAAFMDSMEKANKFKRKVRNRGPHAPIATNEIHPSEYKDPVPFSHR